MSYMFSADYEPMLPFKRGLTAYTDQSANLTSDRENTILGKAFTRPNVMELGLGPSDMPVTLLAVKNVSGSTLTTSTTTGAHYAHTLKWSGFAHDYGRAIGGVTTSASEWLAGILDPMYAVTGVNILNKDVFYIVIGGPCTVWADSTASLATGAFIRCSGTVNGHVVVGVPGTNANCFGVMQEFTSLSYTGTAIVSVPSISS